MNINKTTVLFKLEHEILSRWGYDVLHKFRKIITNEHPPTQITNTERYTTEQQIIDLNLTLKNTLEGYSGTTESRLWLDDNLDEESYIKVLIDHVIPNLVYCYRNRGML